MLKSFCHKHGETRIEDKFCTHCGRPTFVVRMPNFKKWAGIGLAILAVIAFCWWTVSTLLSLSVRELLVAIILMPLFVGLGRAAMELFIES